MGLSSLDMVTVSYNVTVAGVLLIPVAAPGCCSLVGLSRPLMAPGRCQMIVICSVISGFFRITLGLVGPGMAWKKISLCFGLPAQTSGFSGCI